MALINDMLQMCKDYDKGNEITEATSLPQAFKV